MELNKLLADKRTDILKKWREAIISSYPEESQNFLRREKSQFANPVGLIISKEIETLYDEIIRGEDPDRISSSLDTIIRIRAVQDFQPSGALAFVLQLKQIVREAVGASHGKEMETLDRRVDDALLLAFDVYSACRQKLAEIRVNEVRNQVGRLLEKANLIKEIPDQSPAL
ncbi:MAG TPA: hypothetical protein ENH37_03700 [Deltaproteobacteria bacterium]|nr:hypothetical protein [Deltaproteobacteria bacterium]